MFEFIKENTITDYPTDRTPAREVLLKEQNKKLTEGEVLLAFAEMHGDIYDYQIDPKEEKRMFQEMQSIDYLPDYLRTLSAIDMQQYFAATTDQQRDIIRGRMARVATLRVKLGERKDTKVKTKLKGLRYG